MTEPLPSIRAEIERRVIDRAQSDDGFRARLLDDPSAALGELLGATLPARIQIRVVAESPELMWIVLPVDLSGMSHDAIWAMIGEPPA